MISPSLEIVLIDFLKAGAEWFRKGANPVVSAPATLPGAPKKSHHKKKPEAPIVPAPKVEPAPEAPKPETPAPAPAADIKPQTPDELQLAAVAVAKEYIQRFQKSDPDGMSKIRTILADKFKVEAIRALKPDDKRAFMKILEAEMTEGAK